MGWDAFCTGEEKGLINMTYADIIQALWTAWQNDNSMDRNENYLGHIHPSGDHSSPLSRSRLTVNQHRRDHAVAHRVELRRDVSRKKHVTKENTLPGVFLATPVRWLRQLWQHLFLSTCSTRPSRDIGGGSRVWTAPTRPSSQSLIIIQCQVVRVW